MSDLKKQLIKLGSTNPELRPHLTPVLDAMKVSSANLVIKSIEPFDDLTKHLQMLISSQTAPSDDVDDAVVLAASLAQKKNTDMYVYYDSMGKFQVSSKPNEYLHRSTGYRMGKDIRMYKVNPRLECFEILLEEPKPPPPKPLKMKSIRPKPIMSKYLQGVKRLRIKNRGDLENALESAAATAQKMNTDVFVFLGNSYMNAVWYTSIKKGDYLNAINNTGTVVYKVTPDLEVFEIELDRARL